MDLEIDMKRCDHVTSYFRSPISCGTGKSLVLGCESPEVLALQEFHPDCCCTKF